jgi:hypothetical protein
MLSLCFTITYVFEAASRNKALKFSVEDFDTEYGGTYNFISALHVATIR